MREPDAPPAVPLALLEANLDRLTDLLEQVPAVVATFRGPDHVVEFANPGYVALAGGVPLVGRPVAEVFDQPEDRPLVELLDQVYVTGERHHGSGSGGAIAGREVHFDFVYVPLRAADGSVSGVLMHAVEVTSRVGAERAAAESELRYRTLTEANVVGVCIADARLVLDANDAFLSLCGRTREDLEAGRIDWAAMTPPEWAAADARAIEGLRARGRYDPYEKEFVRPDGVRVPLLVGGAALEREPVRLISVTLDLTDRRAADREREILLAREREARREAELAAGRIARLQRITALLSAAISADDVAELIVESAVEALGAAAGVVVLAEGDELVLRRHQGYEPGVVAPWERFDSNAPVPLADAIRTREPILIDDLADWVERYPALREHLSTTTSLAAVPFVFHGTARGAMGLSFDRSHPFTASDRGFLLALGRQCAQALERARLYEERAYVAQTLQHGLLPERLADVPGVEVAVRYHSISDGGAVGGDFYDLFDVDEDRWLLAIGDVCGKGTAAAVLTGLARHTIRAIAMREERPEAVLGFLNEAMRRQLGDSAYCTVGCATLTRRPDGRITTRIASGGHVYPLLIRGGEPVREIEVPGTLLGFVADLELTPVSFDPEPGDVLVFYTDGVTDARDERDHDGERFGEPRLHAVLDAARDGSAEDIAAAVDAAVLAHQPEHPRDDRAVMVLRFAA